MMITQPGSQYAVAELNVERLDLNGTVIVFKSAGPNIAYTDQSLTLSVEPEWVWQASSNLQDPY